VIGAKAGIQSPSLTVFRRMTHFGNQHYLLATISFKLDLRHRKTQKRPKHTGASKRRLQVKETPLNGIVGDTLTIIFEAGHALLLPNL